MMRWNTHMKSIASDIPALPATKIATQQSLQDLRDS